MENILVLAIFLVAIAYILTFYKMYKGSQVRSRADQLINQIREQRIEHEMRIDKANKEWNERILHELDKRHNDV